MAVDYQKIAEGVLANVGGKDNVASATHCMTRLRLTFKPAASPYFSLRLTEQDQKPDKLLDITEKLMNDFEQYFVL